MLSLKIRKSPIPVKLLEQEASGTRCERLGVEKQRRCSPTQQYYSCIEKKMCLVRSFWSPAFSLLAQQLGTRSLRRKQAIRKTDPFRTDRDLRSGTRPGAPNIPHNEIWIAAFKHPPTSSAIFSQFLQFFAPKQIWQLLTRWEVVYYDTY